MQDLRELLGEGLDLPIGGDTYHVSPPTGKEGMRLQLMRDLSAMITAGVSLSKADRKRLRLDDNQEINFYDSALGDTYQKMVDGGCTSYEIRLAASCAYLYFTAPDPALGLEQVESFLADQDPRRAATGQQTTQESPPTPDGSESASTAAASTTKRRNSGSTTSSRTGTSRKAPKAATSPEGLRSVS